MVNPTLVIFFSLGLTTIGALLARRQMATVKFYSVLYDKYYSTISSPKELYSDLLLSR